MLWTHDNKINNRFVPEITADMFDGFSEHFWNFLKKKTSTSHFKSFLMKTSMVWPSQNFLLYNETIIKIKVNEWINNLKKISYAYRRK